MSGDCGAFHQEVLNADGTEYRVFRCDWGWCVKRGADAFRARMLLDAFEQAYRGPLPKALLGRVVGAIERALEAEHARTGRTASTTLSSDDPRLTRLPAPTLDPSAEAAF